MSVPYNQTTAPCGTYTARRRHKRRNETCDTCKPIQKRKPLAPCGTPVARDRHKRRGETCPTCTTARAKELKPCGTYAAYQRHKKRGEPACDPCLQAHADRATAERERYRQNNPRTKLTGPEIINEITFLLNAGEGEARILQATGYENRREALRHLLHKHRRTDLANRVLNHWDLAA